MLSFWIKILLSKKKKFKIFKKVEIIPIVDVIGSNHKTSRSLFWISTYICNGDYLKFVELFKFELDTQTGPKYLIFLINSAKALKRDNVTLQDSYKKQRWVSEVKKQIKEFEKEIS